MKQVSPSASLRGLARRYRRAEDAGFPDVLLTVVFAAGGLATGGIVLLAYVPTHAVLLVAYALAVAATLAVLLTIAAMVTGEDTPAQSDLSTPGREERSASGEASVTRRHARPERFRDGAISMHP